MDTCVKPSTRIKNVKQTFDRRLRSAAGLYNKKFPSRDDILIPWLKDRTLSLVHAPTGVGKSWFVWGIAVGIASGSGFASWKVSSPKRILIIDGEMHPQDLQYRLKKLMQQSALSSSQKDNLRDNFYIYARLDQDVDSDQEFTDLNDIANQDELLQIIEEVDPELIILDNLSTLANLDDENAAASYNNIFRFLTKLKQDRAGILVHHDRKNSAKSDFESYRGSSKLSAIFEFIIHLSHVEIENKKTLNGADFYVRFTKNRYLGDNTLRSRQFTLHPDKGWVVSEDEEDKLQQVAAAVKSARYATQEELAKKFDCSKSWINKLIKRCVNNGYLAEWDWKNYSDIAKDSNNDK